MPRTISQAGFTQQKASAQAGFGVESIRSAAIRLSIPWLERSSLEKTLLPRVRRYRLRRTRRAIRHRLSPL